MGQAPRGGASVPSLEDLMDPSVVKREEAGLVEKLSNLYVCFGLGTCCMQGQSIRAK